jgi:hypothetical protein
MANVTAINEVLATITFIAESDDGDMIGYWHGPERTPIDAAPIVKLDTEGQFDLMRGRALSEAMLGTTRLAMTSALPPAGPGSPRAASRWTL